MSNRGAAMAEAIVPFAPKSHARAETGDPLDRAGQTILSALDRAAGAVEAKYLQAVEKTLQSVCSAPRSRRPDKGT